MRERKREREKFSDKPESRGNMIRIPKRQHVQGDSYRKAEYEVNKRLLDIERRREKRKSKCRKEDSQESPSDG